MLLGKVPCVHSTWSLKLGNHKWPVLHRGPVSIERHPSLCSPMQQQNSCVTVSYVNRTSKAGGVGRRSVREAYAGIKDFGSRRSKASGMQSERLKAESHKSQRLQRPAGVKAWPCPDCTLIPPAAWSQGQLCNRPGRAPCPPAARCESSPRHPFSSS